VVAFPLISLWNFIQYPQDIVLHNNREKSMLTIVYCNSKIFVLIHGQDICAFCDSLILRGASSIPYNIVANLAYKTTCPISK
jgi:hypothetical protein